MHYFYSQNNFDHHFTIEGDEAIHAHVLRLKLKEKIAIVNGTGTKYIAEVAAIEKKTFSGIILEKMDIPMPLVQLNIALSPTKNIDRYEWFIEKATELGVNSFIPLITFQSERRQVNVDRIRKIILAAMKQSGRAYLPTISEPITLKEYLLTIVADQKIIAHNVGKLWSEYLMSVPTISSVAAMIGPEGDFTEEELLLAIRSKFIPISLGEYRLRTETAGLKLAALVIK